MSDESEKVLQMLAQADEMPVESDAPLDGGPQYDAGLIIDLQEHGPDALKEYGQIVVRGTSLEAKYNSAVWYALSLDLHFENKGDCVVITDPAGFFDVKPA